MIRRALGSRFVPVLLGSLCLAAIVVQALTQTARAYPRPGHLERVDVSTEGRSTKGSCSRYSSISADGRYVAFDTDAPLGDGDINEEVDVYSRDLKRGTTELISRGVGGTPALGGADSPGCLGRSLSWDPSITPDGRYVAFSSHAMNLVVGDTNGLADVFVFDRDRRVVERVSVNSEGEQTISDVGCPTSGCHGFVAGHSTRPSISADGRYISFTSTASNLVRHDTNDFVDAFVHDRKSGKTIRVSIDSEGRESYPCSEPRSYQCYLTWGEIASSISSNGRYVVFDSRSPDLVADDTNGIYDVFVHDLKTRRTERVSVASDGTEGQDLQGNRVTGMSGWSGSTITGGVLHDPARVISANGRFITFASTATNLVPNDTNRHGAVLAYFFAGGMDIFVHDRKTGRTERASVASDGREQNLCGEVNNCHAKMPSISADGRYIGYQCEGGCTLSRERKRDSTVAVFDRRTGAVVHAPITKHGDASFPGLPSLSPSGRHISYATQGSYREGPDAVSRFPIALYLHDRGSALGVGGFVRRGEPPEEPDDDWICIIPEVCSPPGGVSSKSGHQGDASNRSTTSRGARIIAARLAYRPLFDDLYMRLDVSEMPSVHGTPIVGDPVIVYGFRFEIESAVYEVRAARAGADSALQPEFGLFRCDGGICTEVTRLEGGYGTTGPNVVAALPLSFLGLENVGLISRLKAFTAYGTSLAGDLAIVHEVELR